ncbi:unnamed protein product [Rotaria sp. Silwood2]|nr:unnamed protein product [Rotaria sp. Silwood2]CAF4408146.1 unnamed protein product [Rotaria sp. Silwood2]
MNNSIAGLTGSSFRTILIVIALYSMSNVIPVIEGRFLWDLSLYCIDYCSRNNGQMAQMGVCSCHRIASYSRRTTNNNLEKEGQPDSPYYIYQQPN